MLRMVRRRQRWSQRDLAARTGIHSRTVAAVEAGQRRPTLAVLTAVLESAGLELAVELPPPAPTPELLVFLRRSLTRRLVQALGDQPGSSRHGPLWEQLRTLARHGDVVLHGAAARALWLPREQPLAEIEVCFRCDEPRSDVANTPQLHVLPSCAAHAGAPVAVSLESWQIGVDPPAELALQPAFAADRPLLRCVARVLHEDAAVDLAGRRVAAHKDPAHAAEEAYVFHTKRFGQRPMPDRGDRRGWRLQDDASLAAWLLRYGYPV